MAESLKPEEKKPEEPLVLNNTETNAVRSFIKSYESYQEQGGEKELVDFISPSLKEFLEEIKGIKKGRMEAFLRSLLPQVNYLEKINKLKSAISVDLSLATGELICQSLYVSYTDALRQEGLEKSFQKKLLLQKFPEDFQEMYEAYESTPNLSSSNIARDMGSFWKNVFSVQADYDWKMDKTQSKHKKSVYASPDDGYETDYRDTHQKRVLRSQK